MGALQLVAASVGAGILTSTIKNYIDRPRPSNEPPPQARTIPKFSAERHRMRALSATMQASELSAAQNQKPRVSSADGP
jgi:hypothetical protein